MQETRWDGTDVLTDHATDKSFTRALDDVRNRSVTLHKPGSIVELKSGSYVVDESGAWRRIRDADMDTFRAIESDFRRREIALELQIADLRQQLAETKGERTET